MYGYLEQWVGSRVGAVLCALWFAGLILGILMSSVEPLADFRYGRY